MGREIRRVPAGWEHPTYINKHRGGEYHPLFDRSYKEAAEEWLKECIDWTKDILPSYTHAESYKENPFYWDYAGMPPDKEYYRPEWTEEERTHYQMYETVSEGTPITPVFATLEELADYLVNVGTEWGGPWDRETAERFCKVGYAPSMIITDGKILTPETGGF